MRRVLAFASARLAGWVLVRVLTRRRGTIELAPPAADSRADELREKLAETRAVVDERERDEAGETTIDAAEPAPADPDARRRIVHERGARRGRPHAARPAGSVGLPPSDQRGAAALSVEVVFETHSLTEDNERGIATGWLDGRLSENGRRLAMELGERRRSERLAAVFTSDLGRAVETAEIAFGGGSIPILKDWRLRECNYGAMNGYPVGELTKERPLRIDTPFPDGESWRQAVERHGWFLRDLVRQHDGEHVLLIGHVSTWWALDHFVSGEALEDFARAPREWRGWLYEVTADSARGSERRPPFE